MIDAHVRANSIPESAGELSATVGDNVNRYAMLADHPFEKHSCQFRSVDVLPAGEADCHHNQSVYDCQNPSVC